MEAFTRRDEIRDEPVKDGDGENVLTPARTPGQVAADALGEICRVALRADEAGSATGNERPRIVITTGIETLCDAQSPADAANDAPTGPASNCLGAYSDHLGPISQRLLARLACDSVLQRAVFSPSGAVLDLGREVRTVTKAQRRALNTRDRGCCMPGCTAPARRCEAHHVTYWRHGGRTDLENLALLCGSCHTQVHLGVGWDLIMIHGRPWVRPPEYVDPQRRLIRNSLHDALDQARNFGPQLSLPPDGAADQPPPEDPPPEHPQTETPWDDEEA